MTRTTTTDAPRRYITWQKPLGDAADAPNIEAAVRPLVPMTLDPVDQAIGTINRTRWAIEARSDVNDEDYFLVLQRAGFSLWKKGDDGVRRPVSPLPTLQDPDDRLQNKPPAQGRFTLFSDAGIEKGRAFTTELVERWPDDIPFPKRVIFDAEGSFKPHNHGRRVIQEFDEGRRDPRWEKPLAGFDAVIPDDQIPSYVVGKPYWHPDNIAAASWLFGIGQYVAEATLDAAFWSIIKEAHPGTLVCNYFTSGNYDEANPFLHRHIPQGYRGVWRSPFCDFWSGVYYAIRPEWMDHADVDDPDMALAHRTHTMLKANRESNPADGPARPDFSWYPPVGEDFEGGSIIDYVTTPRNLELNVRAMDANDVREAMLWSWPISVNDWNATAAVVAA